MSRVERQGSAENKGNCQVLTDGVPLSALAAYQETQYVIVGT